MFRHTLVHGKHQILIKGFTIQQLLLAPYFAEILNQNFNGSCVPAWIGIYLFVCVVVFRLLARFGTDSNRHTCQIWHKDSLYTNLCTSKCFDFLPKFVTSFLTSCTIFSLIFRLFCVRKVE